MLWREPTRSTLASMDFTIDSVPHGGADVDALVSRVTELARCSPFSAVVDSSMGASSGTGIRVEDGDILVGYAYAVANPDGEAWTMEAATTSSGDVYEEMLSGAVDCFRKGGVGEIVLWVHIEGQEPVVGFSLERELHMMATRLPIDSSRTTDDEVTIRGFRSGDEDAWLAVNNRAFAGHPEQSGWDHRTLATRMGYGWFDPEGLRMVWMGDRLAAFNWTKVHPTSAHDETVGEIFVIAVDPAFRGRGLGRTATIDGLHDLASRRGATRAILYVDAASTAGMSLYKSVGFRSEEIHRAFRSIGKD